MTGDSLLRRVVTRRLWPPQLCASTWHRRSLSSAPSKVSTHTQCLPQTRCWQLVISASHAAVYDRNARQKKQQQAAVLLFITSNNLLQIIYALRLPCCEWVWWRCNPDRVKKRLAHDKSTVCVCVSLTVCVLNLQSDGDTVTDANPHLASCCELLELVLRKGLQRQHLP